MARMGLVAIGLLVLTLAAWLLRDTDPPATQPLELRLEERRPSPAPGAQLAGQAAPPPKADPRPGAAALPERPHGPYVFYAHSAETEGALAGVEIETEEGERVGTTGPDGRLRIDDGGAPSLVVRATLPGHIPFHGTATAGSRLGIVLYPGVRVRGRVRDARDGSGIFGARLRVWDVDSAREIATLGSGEDGRFEIASVRPNRPFRIVTTVPGLVPHEQTENVDVAVDDLEIEVGGGAVLEGRVTIRRGGVWSKREVLLVPSGHAVPGRTRARRHRADLPGHALERLARTATDEEGAFRFAGVPRGRAYQAVVLVGPRFEARSGPVFIRSDEETYEAGIEIGEAASLRIHVVDEAERPVPGVEVVLTTPTETWRPGPKDRQADGSYLLPVLTPGSVRIDATLEAAPPLDPPESLRLRPGFEEEVTLAFPAGLPLAGVVTDKRGEPVLQAQVRWRSVSGAHAATTTDGDGQFAFRRLPKDGGTLRVHARNVLNSRRGYELYEDDTLAPGPGRVRIVLKDGTQVTGAFPDIDKDDLLEVTLVPTGPGDAGTAWMDEQHRFAWRGPPAERSGQLVFRTPGYPPLVVPLLTPFRSEEVRDLGDLQFEASYPALGRVLDEWGHPLRAAKVTLVEPWFAGRSQRTNRDGEFEFSRLPERDVPVRIEAIGLPPNNAVLGANSHKQRQEIRVFTTGTLPLTLLEPDRSGSGAYRSLSRDPIVLGYRHESAAGRATVRFGRLTGEEGAQGPSAQEKRADAQGTLELRLAPGRWRITARNDRGRSATLDITIDAGQRYPNTLRLETETERSRRESFRKHWQALLDKQKRAARK